MNILMLCDKMGIGGAETHILTLMKSLCQSGDRITLICAYGDYVPTAKKLGIRYIEAPLDKRDLVSIIRSVRILKKYLGDFDVIHSHTRFTSTLIHYLRQRSGRAPTVTTAHLCFPLGLLSKYTKWGDETLAVSEDIKGYLKTNYRLTDKRIRVTKNCIDQKIHGNLHSDEKRIIHVSRIDTDRSKTAFALIRIAEKLFREYPHHTIVIIGKGDKYNELKWEADRMNQRIGIEYIKLIGGTTSVDDHLCGGGIFVGVSRAALEAAAVGLPVIICGDEGYGGILSEENFTFLSKSNFCARGCQKEDDKTLLTDINKLLSDEEYSKKEAEYIKKQVFTLYDPKIGRDDAKETYRLSRLKRRVLLFGYFGYGNLGDEGMLYAAKKLLSDLGYENIGVMTASSGALDGCIHYNRFSYRDVSLALKSSDLLVICGGNLLQNETGLPSLLYYSAIIDFAKRMGLTVYMLSSGIGQLLGKQAEKIAEKAISKCDYFGARTRRDLTKIRGYGNYKRAELMPDLCFTLSSPKVNEANGKRDKIAIIACDNLFDHAEIIEDELKKTNLLPIIISLFPLKDNSIANAFAKAFGSELILPSGWEEFCNILTTCKYTISARLHGAIFSIISHTPCYLSTDGVKNPALIEEIDKRCRIIGCNTPLLPVTSLGKENFDRDAIDFPALIDSLKSDTKKELLRIFC